MVAYSGAAARAGSSGATGRAPSQPWSLQPCGIRGMGFVIPDKELDVLELARAAGVPEIVAEFAGARTVREAPADLFATEMGVEAGLKAVDAAGMCPDEVDLLVWCGAAVPDYLMPTTAGAVQDGIGCRRAQAFDVAQGCSAMLTGLQVAHGQLALDPGCRTALVVTGDKWSAFTNHHNADSVFFGDGGGAVVLLRDHPEFQPVAYHTLTRGEFHGLWMLEGGGLRRPASHDTVDAGHHVYRCLDAERAHGEFKEIYVPTLAEVARTALNKAGIGPEDVAFFSMVNANLRVLEFVCDAVGIPVERSSASYLRQLGHFGAMDVFLNLDLAVGEGRVGKGDYALLLTTGIGFFWVAAVLRR